MTDKKNETNIGIGIAIGAGVGVAIGVAMGKKGTDAAREEPPGALPQLVTAIDRGHADAADVVLLSIGGNDVFFFRKEETQVDRPKQGITGRGG